jgi:hypothetical protein
VASPRKPDAEPVRQRAARRFPNVFGTELSLRRSTGTVMTDQTAELRALADRLCERDAVEDAWLAKSFTDQLLVVNLSPDASLPTEA